MVRSGPGAVPLRLAAQRLPRQRDVGAGAGADRPHRGVRVMHRRSRAGEAANRLHFHAEGFSKSCRSNVKRRLVEQSGDIARARCGNGRGNHLLPGLEQALTQMPADEAGSAPHHHPRGFPFTGRARAPGQCARKSLESHRRAAIGDGSHLQHPAAPQRVRHVRRKAERHYAAPRQAGAEAQVRPRLAFVHRHRNGDALLEVKPERQHQRAQQFRPERGGDDAPGRIARRACTS